MKSAQSLRVLLPWLLVLAFCLPASAKITLYDKEGTTFNVDGFFNTFYVYHDDTDQEQSRVRYSISEQKLDFFNSAADSGQWSLPPDRCR
jgi:hypothetical protein